MRGDRPRRGESDGTREAEMGARQRSQGMPQPQRLEEARKGYSSDTQPWRHLDFSLENLISASGLQDCEIINVWRFVCFFATKFGVICYSIHRKLIPYTINIKFKY